MTPRPRLLLTALLFLSTLAGGVSCSPAKDKSTPDERDAPDEDAPVPTQTTRLRRTPVQPAMPDDGFIRDGSLRSAKPSPLTSPDPTGGEDLLHEGPSAAPVATRRGEDPFKAIPSSVDNRQIRHEGIGLGTGAPAAPAKP